MAVPDLDRSVAQFESRYGLAAVAGGRHPGVGTANAIVPLGGFQYLELITVVDRAEAERDPLRQRLLRALDAGATFATWALRAQDLGALREPLGLGTISDGARVRPDGVRLAWRSAEPPGTEAGSGVPFLIEWLSADHPGGAGAPGRVRRVVVEDGGGRLRQFLDQVEIDVEVVVRDGAAPRLLAVELENLAIE